MLENQGIYIVGGRYDEWVSDHFYFDLKKIEITPRPNLIKSLFGPAMTKPIRTNLDEITFFVAGGALDSNKTEIYHYLETEGKGTWN